MISEIYSYKKQIWLEEIEMVSTYVLWTPKNLFPDELDTANLHAYDCRI